MIKKLHIYFVILTLGLFLVPSLTYACGTQSEKECCKMETTSKQEHKGCSEESHAADKNSGCDGQCGHSNCTTTSVQVSLALFSQNEFAYTFFNFPNEKQKFYSSKTFISSGHTSLWLIPKIG